jgi:rhomboid family GlyGly-CTERM serine protease
LLILLFCVNIFDIDGKLKYVLDQEPLMFNWLPSWMKCNGEQRRALLVFAIIGVIIAIAALFDDAGRATLGLVPDKVLGGEVWRIFTSHIVHLSRMHAFMNELGLVLLIVVLWDVLEPKGLLFATALSAIAIGVGIMIFLRDIPYYVGWSGVTHGLFAWGGLRLWQIHHRGYASLVLGVVVAKLIWEAAEGPTPGASEAIGGLILLESHRFGAIGGALAAILGPKLWRASLLALLVPAVLVLPGTPAQAHSLKDTVANVHVDNAGDVVLSLDIEVAAFVLREPAGALSAEARARVLSMPEVDLQDYIDGAGAFLLTTARFIGENGGQVRAERIRMPTPSALRRHAETQANKSKNAAPLLMVFKGADVLALDRPRLLLPGLVGPLFLIVSRSDGSEGIEILPPGVASQPLDLAVSGSVWQVIAKSIADGVRHVVPTGWDHALFMATLALATPLVLSCLLHATVFTLAHSITLFLASLSIVSLPLAWVEVGIALTVATAGIDTAWRLRKGGGAHPVALSGRSRLVILFSFGLLHGLGFASVFSNLPIARESLIPSLFGFNLGVELGQMIVILAVLSLLTVLRNLGSENTVLRSRIGMSAAIAAVGSIWVVERMSGLLS